MAQRKPQPALTPAGEFLTTRDQTEIDRYLFEHPGLGSALPEIKRRLGALFGPGEEFDLHLSGDPDGYGLDDPLLHLRVVTSLDGPTATERLDRFDDWWIHQPTAFQMALIIDFDLR
jgi:hypothetical protein